MTKKRKPKSKNYFTEDTEIAIIAYNNEPNSEIRSDIYRKEIHYPLFKLTENIIHTFKFYHTEVNNLEHLQHEIITMLLDRLHKFSPKHNIQDKLNKIRQLVVSKDYLEASPQFGVGKNNLRRVITI